MSSRLLRELISDEDRRSLMELRERLTEIIETIDLLLNPEALEGLREAEEDIKAGRLRDWEEFLKDIGKY